NPVVVLSQGMRIILIDRFVSKAKEVLGEVRAGKPQTHFKVHPFHYMGKLPMVGQIEAPGGEKIGRIEAVLRREGVLSKAVEGIGVAKPQTKPVIRVVTDRGQELVLAGLDL